jgi:hypothetical protein
MESGADSGAGVEGVGAGYNGEVLHCFGRQMKLL